jgi:hypothetical protein
VEVERYYCARINTTARLILRRFLVSSPSNFPKRGNVRSAGKIEKSGRPHPELLSFALVNGPSSPPRPPRPPLTVPMSDAYKARQGPRGRGAGGRRRRRWRRRGRAIESKRVSLEADEESTSRKLKRPACPSCRAALSALSALHDKVAHSAAQRQG